MGESVSEVKKYYLNSIPYFLAGWKKSSGYVQMVEMLSIGIVLEIEETEFNKLAECVQKDNPKDYLIDLLINYRNSTWETLSTKFMWNKP
ncbi:hypothetical protein ABIB40_004228 [Pedobacter sp. UYP30]